jgi:4-oxalmesaconate hydratase
LLRVVGVDNVLFASEMLGGVTTIDPLTGRYFDDNKPCLDMVDWLTAADRRKIFEENVVRVYPRLASILERRQKQVRAV